METKERMSVQEKRKIEKAFLISLTVTSIGRGLIEGALSLVNLRVGSFSALPPSNYYAMQQDSGTPPTNTKPAPGTIDVHALYSRLLGNPQANADKAISTFQEEFEAKKTLFTEKDDETVSKLQRIPALLSSAKEHLDSDISGTQSTAKLTVERLQALQQAIAVKSQAREKSANPTRSAKAAFENDINDAREAFDQEMALRHADVVRQYVGAFVNQIDRY